MHEREKLQEAGYFLQRMSSVSSQPVAFKHELSAFMAAGRSVLQYAHKESEGNPPAATWYQKTVTSDPVIDFFKDKRNASIHSEPVRPKMQVSAEFSSSITPTGSLHLRRLDKDGNVLEERSVHGPPTPPAPSDPPRMSYIHTFPDWKGPEDVLTLGQKYVNSLTSFVNNGVAKGFISG